MQEKEELRQPGNGGRSVGDELGRRAAAMGDEVKNQGARVARKVRREAERRADGARSAVADEIDQVASAIHGACEELRGGSTAEKTMHWAAGQLERTAERIRSQDASELVNELGNFARRNPSMFLGGAALLGFAVSRFAKASARRHDERSGHSPDLAPDLAADFPDRFGASESQGQPFTGANSRTGTDKPGSDKTQPTQRNPMAPSAPTATTTPGGSFQSSGGSQG